MEDEPQELQLARQRLVEHLKHEGIRDRAVLEAIESVPRHVFVYEHLLERAYDDAPLPIGHGQTISQPYIVAQMTATLCHGKRLKKVLEIGTGCGYQTAVLAKLVEQVYSIERIKNLSQVAQMTLKNLNIENVTLKYGDGYQGWVEYAPYDGILVTAAPEHIPETLLNQLAEGGRMVIPVGELGYQKLMLIEHHQGNFKQTFLEGVRFVPLMPGLDE